MPRRRSLGLSRWYFGYGAKEMHWAETNTGRRAMRSMEVAAAQRETRADRSTSGVRVEHATSDATSCVSSGPVAQRGRVYGRLTLSSSTTGKGACPREASLLPAYTRAGVRRMAWQLTAPVFVNCMACHDLHPIRRPHVPRCTLLGRLCGSRDCCWASGDSCIHPRGEI